MLTMLISISQNYRGIIKPLLSFWLLCTSMVFCAMSTASPEGRDDQQFINCHKLHGKQHAHELKLGEPPLNSLIAADSVGSDQPHANFLNDSGQSHALLQSASVGWPGNQAANEMQPEPDHGSVCCEDARGTANSGIAPIDLPASAVLLILLVFFYRYASPVHSVGYLQQPSWSSPPIPLLHCSFLK
jgi:hypothetical protein